MPRVNIIMEPGETIEEAEEAIIKSLSAQGNGDLHDDAFMDPVMEQVSARMKQLYVDLNREMIKEIEEVLEREGV